MRTDRITHALGPSQKREILAWGRTIAAWSHLFELSKASVSAVERDNTGREVDHLIWSWDR